MRENRKPFQFAFGERGRFRQSVCKHMPYLRQNAVTGKVDEETDAKACNDLFPRRILLFPVDPSNRGRQECQTNYKRSHKSGPIGIREANRDWVEGCQLPGEHPQ